LRTLGVRLGVIVEPKERTLLTAESLLAEGGPRVGGDTRWARAKVLRLCWGCAGEGGQVDLLAPSRGVVRVPITAVDAALAGALSVPGHVAAFCAQAGLSQDGARAAERILRAKTAGELCSGFSFAPAETGFVARFIEAGAVRVLTTRSASTSSLSASSSPRGG
jgi:hypothetical protein